MEKYTQIDLFPENDEKGEKKQAEEIIEENKNEAKAEDEKKKQDEERPLTDEERRRIRIDEILKKGNYFYDERSPYDELIG